MIVVLTHAQQRAVRHRVPELHARAMREHRTAYGRAQHEVELPPIAWRQILDVLRKQAFGPMGGKLDRGVPGSVYRAIKRIAEQVMRIENHPALYVRAVEGWVGDLVLGWRYPGEQLGTNNPDARLAVWDPYPAYGMQPELLRPAHIVVHDRQCTVWRPSLHPERDAWSLDPEAHLAFREWAVSQDRAST